MNIFIGTIHSIFVWLYQNQTCSIYLTVISSRKLKSSSQILLQVPVSQRKSYGDVLGVAAPIWGIGCWQILEMCCLLKV